MTELHNQRLKDGLQNVIATVDEQSYRALLFHVPRNRKRILELGSASGGQWNILADWTPHGDPIVGIDLYEPLVTKAQADGKLIYEGYVEDMYFFPDESFDLICSRHVMEHLGDVDRGIQEISRVLKPGGYSAHVTPDMVGDNEPAHLNKWPVSDWAKTWESFDFNVIFAKKYPFHGGESHIVCRKKV
jgi:SAM-dependent methyltransferase